MSKLRDPIDWEETLPIRPSSLAWRAAIRALYGSALSADEHEAFLRLSGGVQPPDGGALEMLVVAGRRGGKTETLARLATFEGIHGGHQRALAPGQVGLFAIVCPVREQATEMIRYVHGLASLPQLSRHVVRKTVDGVEFRTNVAARVLTADAVSVAGFTLIGAVRDEWARFPAEGAASPDTEIDAALRPGLAPIVGAPARRLLGITSAFVMAGLAYRTDVENHGRAGADVLVLRGDTLEFNPNVDRAWLERERRRLGPAVFAREFEGRWQSPSEVAFETDLIASCTAIGVREREPIPNGHYVMGVDLGLRRDATALTVLHRELRYRADGPPTDLVVQDAVRHLKPGIVDRARRFVAEAARSGAAERLTLEEVEDSIVRLAARYGVRVVVLDLHYADALGPRLRDRGFRVVEAPSHPKAQEERGALLASRLATGGVLLLDHAAQTGELRQVRTKVSGTRIVLEARGGRHDDLVDALLLGLEAAVDLSPSGGNVERVVEGSLWAAVHHGRPLVARWIHTDDQGRRHEVPPPPGSADDRELRARRIARGEYRLGDEEAEAEVMRRLRVNVTVR